MLNGRFIALGVTGSIAAYKAVDLASKLTQAGASVDVLMTESATVEAVRGQVTATVVKLPFFSPRRKTATPVV